MSNSPVIWRPDFQNRWGLYANTDYKLPQIADEDADDQKNKSKSKALDSAFYFSKLKQEIKGTMICTPKGYGIIQSIDPVKNTITVKVQGVVHEFDKNEVMSELPILVIFLKDSMKVEEIVYLPVNSSIKEVFERVEGSLKTSADSYVDIKLFFKGRELEKSDDTIERLRIAPLSKFLVTYAPGKPLCVNRFPTIHPGWCVGGNGIDGICFQVTKNIRVIGFGLYPSTNQESLPGVAKLYQGENTSSTMVANLEINMVKNKDPGDNKPLRILFDRPYLVKAGDYWSITVSFPNSGNCFYGSGGLTKVDGEGDVSFSFKNCEGAYNGTGTGSGQIPEIYYYI